MRGLKVAARTRPKSSVALLGDNALLGVALAVAEAEQLLEAVLEVQLAPQPKPLAKGMATALPSLTWAKV